MNQLFSERIKHILTPEFRGSYSDDDCIFLLKNVNGLISEENNETREHKMASGLHYSEMLPIEYIPTPEYMALFQKTLKETGRLIADYVAYVAELILKQRGKDVVLVSLARAGTPIGVLIKRYLKFKYDLNLPHYSISIIRDKGIDENALCYIINRHQTNNLQFIDGWTGKGVINDTLKASLEDFNRKYQIAINPTLAVLADPSYATSMCGTRNDFLIPSACLNSTVSGLASRTFHRADLVGVYDFHGAKYYAEWEGIDLSNYFIEEIVAHFPSLPKEYQVKTSEVLDSGKKEIIRVKEKFNILDANKIKPGVGETTRVLLRRVPWKILVNDLNNPYLKHILLLAKDRNVPVEVFNELRYSCIGLIREE